MKSIWFYYIKRERWKDSSKKKGKKIGSSRFCCNGMYFTSIYIEFFFVRMDIIWWHHIYATSLLFFLLHFCMTMLFILLSFFPSSEKNFSSFSCLAEIVGKFLIFLCVCHSKALLTYSIVQYGMRKKFMVYWSYEFVIIFLFSISHWMKIFYSFHCLFVNKCDFHSLSIA